MAKKKVFAKKRAVRRKKSSKKKTKKSFSFFKWLLGFALLFSLALGGYSLYLSKIVRVKFEGKRWAIPARVYARPLDLYVGADISRKKLQVEMQLLGYRKVKHPQNIAEWASSSKRMLFNTRAFQFWDGTEPNRFVDVRFDGESIAALKDAKGGKAIDLLRLEPPEIGSIYPSHNEDRVLLKREELPEHLVQALLAAEDRAYLSHHGLDPYAIFRALLANVRAGKAVQGGSTLTQQLVKNFYLTHERTLSRKINEALMALLLELRYSKDEILEAYANEVYLGQDGARAIHGFGLAAWYYFGRPLKELQLHETALLVGLLKGASYYNPLRHPERAKKRRDLVLKLMADQRFISAEQGAKAQQHKLGIVQSRQKSSSRHPAFIDLVRRQLRRDYQEQDLSSEGLRIFTTMDPWVQGIAEATASKGLSALEKKRGMPKGTLEIAVVVVAPQGGEIHALVGGRDSKFSGFNRALDAVRPVGSLLKPFVYLTALMQKERYNLVTPLDDRKITLTNEKGVEWSPRNYDRKEHGAVLLHTALAKSYNLATVNLGMDIGIKRVVALLKRFGISRSIQPFPSLLLGATSLSPLEVAQMYQALAAGGFKAPLRAIREVTDAEGKALQRYPLEVDLVADTAAVYLLNRNLVEVVRAGTGRGVYRYLPDGMDVAGKTGTTNNLRDSWFAGFTGDSLAVVWLGRDDNKSTGVTGASGALTIWGQIMQAMKPLPLSLIPPDNVSYQWVDKATGFLSAEHCNDAMAMPFIKGGEPKVLAECHAEQGVSGFLNKWFD